MHDGQWEVLEVEGLHLEMVQTIASHDLHEEEKQQTQEGVELETNENVL